MIEVRITQDNGENRVLGMYNPRTRTLFIKRKRSKHFYKKLNAWGIDNKAFEGLVTQHGMNNIVLYDKDVGKRFTAKAQDFNDHGKYLHFKPYRLQVFLEESYWEEID